MLFFYFSFTPCCWLQTCCRFNPAASVLTLTYLPLRATLHHIKGRGFIKQEQISVCGTEYWFGPKITAHSQGLFDMNLFLVEDDCSRLHDPKKPRWLSLQDALSQLSSVWELPFTTTVVCKPHDRKKQKGSVWRRRKQNPSVCFLCGG